MIRLLDPITSFSEEISPKELKKLTGRASVHSVSSNRIGMCGEVEYIHYYSELLNKIVIKSEKQVRAAEIELCETFEIKDEGWVPYDKFYEVSNYGRCRYVGTKKIRVPSLRYRRRIAEYPIITWREVGTKKQKSKKLSYMIAEAFLDKKDTECYVFHKDNDPFNCRPSNLYWGDKAANQKRVGLKNCVPLSAFDTNMNFISEFGNLRSAVESTFVSESALKRAIYGVYATAGGYLWVRGSRDPDFSEDRETKLIFLDLEFSGLTKDATLISIGAVSDCDKEFYGISTTYTDAVHRRNPNKEWIEKNVLSKLDIDSKKNRVMCKTKAKQLMLGFKKWLLDLGDYDIVFVADCASYDTVILMELLFGDSHNVPDNVCPVMYDIVFDIMKKYKLSLKGAFNKDRSSIVDNFCLDKKNNALYDAQIIKEIYNKIHSKSN